MTETQTKPRLQGQFEWSDAKSIHIQARFDKVALHENRLVFISLVAFSQDVKALRAAFAAGLDSPMRLKNVTLSKDDESTVPGDVRTSPVGYRLDTHRLGFRSIHALFTCRQTGFLPNDSDDALWQELKGFQTPRFSMTPGRSRRRTGRSFSPFSVGCLTPHDFLIRLSTTIVADMFPAANARGPFQESQRCLRTPGAKSSLKTGSVFITASPDASVGPSFAARTRTTAKTLATAKTGFLIACASWPGSSASKFAAIP